MLPREIVKISLDDKEPYEVTAKILGVIAYPDDPLSRQRFADSMVAASLYEMAKTEPERADYSAMRVSYLRTGSQHDRLKVIKDGCRILTNERMKAAGMAINMSYRDRCDGRMPDGRPITLGNLAVEVADILAERKNGPGSVGEGKNVEARNWKKSRSVVHLAWALVIAIESEKHNLSEAFHDGGIDFQCLLDNYEMPRLILGHQMYCAEQVTGFKQGPVISLEEQIYIYCSL